MRYLPYETETKCLQQYVVPRVGVDIPYLNIYATNSDAFYIRITGTFAGSNASPTEFEVFTSWSSIVDSYNDLGYYLIAYDGSEAYRIDQISYAGYIITTLDPMPIGDHTFVIAKYYKPILINAPSISQSTKRQGDLARTGTISLSIANAEEATYTSAYCAVQTATSVRQYPGESIADEDYIGYLCVIKYTNPDYDTQELIIIDVDELNGDLFFNGNLNGTTSADCDVFIIENNYISDIFNTLPHAEEKQIKVYEYLADSVNDIVYGTKYETLMFDGYIQKINEISDSKIDIIGYDKEACLGKEEIGNLITESDGVLINGATIESVGEMKPLIFGKSEMFTQQNSDHELNVLQNNMMKLKYIGVDWESGKRKYIISENAINETYLIGETQTSGTLVVGELYEISDYKTGDSFANVGATTTYIRKLFIATGTTPTTWTNGSELTRYGRFFYKNSAGRLCGIEHGDLSIARDGDGENVILEVGTYDSTSETMLMGIIDYWYGNGSYDNLSAGAGVISYTNLGDAGDNDIDTYAQAIIPDSGGGAPITLNYDITFNQYDATYHSMRSNGTSPDSGGVEIWADCAYTGTSSGSQQLKINGINPTRLIPAQSLSRVHTECGYDSNDRAGINDGITIYCYGDVISAVTTFNIYEVYKKLRLYIEVAGEEEVGDIFLISNGGYKYGTWINNRNAGDSDPNGGYYAFTHPHSDESGSHIENPVDMIEAIFRDTTFGLSLSDSDLDIDTFNRASALRDSYKFVYQIQDITKTEELLHGLCEQSNCVLYERNGKVAIYAYDNTQPFTKNVFGGDGDDYLQIATPSWDTTNTTIQMRVNFSDLSTKVGLFGYGSWSYRYCNATSSGIEGETDTNTDAFSISYTFATDTWYDIELIISDDGGGSGTISLYVNGELEGTDTVTDNSMTFNRIMDGDGYALKGYMEHFRLLDSSGNVMVNIQAYNETITDITNTYAITEYGTILYSIDEKYIFDYYATTTGGEFDRIPILKDGFKLYKSTDDIKNKINANYYFNNDTLNPQTTTTYTDTTLSTTHEITMDFDKTSDATTVGYIKDVIFDTVARRAWEVQFKTTISALAFEIFDIVNIRHPLLRNVFSSIDTKKWIITSVEFETGEPYIIITAVELL